MKKVTLLTTIFFMMLVGVVSGAQLVVDTVGTYDTPQKMMQAADDNFDELYGAFASLAAFESFLTGAGAYASDILGVENEAGLVGLFSNYVDQDVTSGSTPTFAGLTISASATPGWTGNDSDNANGTYEFKFQSSGGDNPIAVTFDVEEDDGSNHEYIELDGPDEQINISKPVVATSLASSYTIVVPQSLSVTADDDVTVGTEITSSVVLCTGDNDSADETLTLQDGLTAGYIQTFIVVANVDDTDDAMIFDAETDSTCLGCPDSGIFTFETEGSQLTLYWTGSAWTYMGSVVGE
jgi:hypothetical protein